jgi:hypothetical protein
VIALTAGLWGPSLSAGEPTEEAATGARPPAGESMGEAATGARPPAGEPTGEAAAGPRGAHRDAVAITGLGTRPAASRGERRAHRMVADRFRSAGLAVHTQRFQVPGRGGSRNVIGVFDTPRRCLRVVMAHIDTMPAGPGANDNASGVGVVMALARRLERVRPGCDVWLVATGSEERLYTGSPDHLGALALVRRVRARGLRERLRWALSLDEVGRGAGFWLRSPASGVRPRVEGALLRAARRESAPVRWVRDEDTGNSDHREFELVGLPAAKLGVGAGGDPCRHAACDRSRRLQGGAFSRARRTVERALHAR